jgi:hypothetical protein
MARVNLAMITCGLCLAMLFSTGCSSSGSCGCPLLTMFQSNDASTVAEAPQPLPDWVKTPAWADTSKTTATYAEGDPQVVFDVRLAHCQADLLPSLGLDPNQPVALDETRAEELLAKLKEHEAAEMIAAPRVIAFATQPASVALIAQGDEYQSGTAIHVLATEATAEDCHVRFAVQARRPVTGDGETNQVWTCHREAELRLAADHWFVEAANRDSGTDTLLILVHAKRIAPRS